MKINEIREKLNSREAGILGQELEYRRFSVVIPLIEIDGELNILFEVRSRRLRSQPGEISFPGGAVEEGETSGFAAVRETCEELNIEEKDIEIIGAGDVMVTQHGKIIYTYAAKIRNDIEINPSRQEVDHIFYVPLKFFMETEPLIRRVKITTEPESPFPYDDREKEKEYYFSPGRSNIYFYKYENNIIWGITAKIMYYFIRSIKEGV